MSAVSKLFLLILVMFIRFSCGIRCYHCMSKRVQCLCDSKRDSYM